MWIKFETNIRTFCISFFPGVGDVRFTLGGLNYQNNSLVTLKDIGEGGDALCCVTDLPACCRHPHSPSALGNWFFPNGTRVPSTGNKWDFHRTRGQMMVCLHRRRDGVDGIYHCEIPDTMGVTQTIYIGVYTAGKCYSVRFSLGISTLISSLLCSTAQLGPIQQGPITVT